MAGLQTIRFRNAEAFKGITGIVDYDKCVVHGVSLITGQMEAEGHDLMVDDTTTSQLFKLAKGAEQVPVYLDHGSGIKELNGYIDNFRMDGKKVRGDWNMLQSHKETPVMLERADRQPKTFGLSVSFKGQGVSVAGGKKAARATKLLSADVVPRPAANKDGLFGAKDREGVDTTKKDMNQSVQSSQNAEPTLADVMGALGTIGTRLDSIEKENKTFREELDTIGAGDGAGQDDYTTLVGLNKMTDAELIAAGTTRAEVNQAVAEWNASVDAAEGGGEGGEGGGKGGGEGAEATAEGAAVAALGGGAEVATAMHSLQKQIVQLAARLNARDKKERDTAEQIQFEEAQAGITELVSKCEEQTNLSAKLQAENQALRIHVRTGTRPVNASMADGERMFSANENGDLHPFQQKVKQIMLEQKVSQGKAIQLASKANSALHLDWVQGGGSKQEIISA